MELIKTIRDDAQLRGSFNDLTERTFGFHFENWHRLGYWRENYCPYAMVEDGRVVANVSVNHTDFLLEGQRVKLIQLGTVMTDPDYRNRGLIRRIMAEIEQDWADKVDGMYLFANDEVLEFYPKFGFVKGRETQYARAVCRSGARTAVRKSMESEENRLALERAMEKHSAGGFPAVGNPGLTFFYVTSFMSECVWYDGALDAWAVAEEDGDTLTLHAVFGAGTEEMIAAFGGVKRAVLGYVPEDTAGYDRGEVVEEDSTFFVKGAFFENFEKRGLRIPTLSHA